MSRALCHSISFCSAVDPVPLEAYCAANLYRFAQSEKDYLLDLGGSVCKLVGEGLVLNGSSPTWWEHVKLPHGGLGEPPLLQGLLGAIYKGGEVAWIRDFESVPAHAWIAEETPTFPPSFKGMHSAALCCFASRAKCSDLGLELSKKWLVTLDKLVMPPIPLNWFEGVSQVLEAAPIFHRMCWLKSVAGAWCTSVRLSTYED